MIITTRGFIVPREFYEQAARDYPAIMDIIGRARAYRGVKMEKRCTKYT